MEKEDWKYIIINGQTNNLKVKNPVFEKGVLTSIEDLKPFNIKDAEVEIGDSKQKLSTIKSEIFELIKTYFHKPCRQNMLQKKLY